MSADNPDLNPGIEACMPAAMQGDRLAAQRFFMSFLDGPLFVPKRFQVQPLSNTPAYPDEFLNILGVLDKERTIVPVFSRPDYIEEWCGASFEYRSMSGRELLQLMPGEWWIVLNPGREIEKELSPWELGEMRAGPEGIAAVIEELYEAQSAQALEIKPLADGEYQALKDALRAAGQQFPEVQKLFLLKEAQPDAETAGVLEARILIGVETDPVSKLRLDEIKAHLKSLADVSQIGSEACRLFAGTTGGEELMLGVFKALAPFYEKTPPARGLWAALLSWWKRSRSTSRIAP